MMKKKKKKKKMRKLIKFGLKLTRRNFLITVSISYFTI